MELEENFILPGFYIILGACFEIPNCVNISGDESIILYSLFDNEKVMLLFLHLLSKHSAQFVP